MSHPDRNVSFSVSAASNAALSSGPTLVTMLEGRSSTNLMQRRTSRRASRLLTAPIAIDEPIEKPSPTTIRLKALARAVRASHSLGMVRSQKYQVHAPDDLLQSRIPTEQWNHSNDAEPRNSTASRPSSASLNGKLQWRSALTKTSQALKTGEVLPNVTIAPISRGQQGKPGTARSHGKPSIARLGSIRGDFNALIGAFDPNPAHIGPAAMPPSELPQNLDARIFCARSLYKLSCQEGYEMQIIEGGAIAQIADFSEGENVTLLRYCAATLANLTTDPQALDAFVLYDGISALLELSWSHCVEVKILCATALARLSKNKIHGKALARARAIIEFLSMIAMQNDRLQVLAVTCILNLVYHGQVFPDRVFLGEPHAVQTELGVMNVVNKLALVPSTMQFAAEALFNMSLYRVSCSGALRGGGAELLFTLAIHGCKILEESGSASSRHILAVNTPYANPLPSPTIASNTAAISLLHLIAETLGNFSAFLEFQSIVSLHGMKTLMLLVVGPLRDFGSKFYGATAEDRLKGVAISCSRALANMSSNGDQRKHLFQQDVVEMVARLFLIDRHRFLESPTETQTFLRNMVRTISNLSFDEACTAHFMDSPHVLQMLHRIAVTRSNEVTNDLSLDIAEDAKEDALVAIINLAQYSVYSNDLLRTLDGKQLTIAASHANLSRRLKYSYAVVLCNLLFESRLQQIIYGDLIVSVLVEGFYFFAGGNDEANTKRAHLKTANLAFDDDQERFIAGICVIASEIMDPVKMELVVELVLDCLMQRAECIPAHRRMITCLAAATLYSLARSSTQRGDTNNIIYSLKIESALINICEQSAACVTSAISEGAVPIVCSVTQAYCAATLYHLCASGHANQRVIQALIACSNANEETQSLLACAASFAIISFSAEGRSQLVCSQHLAKALNRLGRTSQVECQQYAAIAACNVSNVKCIWTSSELKDFIVVTLLRAHSLQAKQIHAKTLCNLLSHPETRTKMVEDGVVYALMKLSQVMLSRTASHVAPDGSLAAEYHDSNKPSHFMEGTQNHMQIANSVEEVLKLGFQALFNLSCEHKFHQKLLSNGVMTYLLAAVPVRHAAANSMTALTRSNSKTSDQLLGSSAPFINSSIANFLLDAESKRCALGIICNLSSYEENHKELMNAQVADVIRKYVDQDIEARASASIALYNLSCNQPWVEMLCERKTLHVLILFTQSEHPVVKQFAIQALANCSLVTDSLHLFGELRVPHAVFKLLDAATSETPIFCEPSMLNNVQSSPPNEMDTCMAALKCLHNVAIDDALALNLMEERAVLHLLQLLEHRAIGINEEACLISASMISILAGKSQCAEALLHHRVVSLCALLYQRNQSNTAIAYLCVKILMKMSMYQQIQSTLVDTQVIHVIVSVCSSHQRQSDARIRLCGAITIRNLTLCVTEHLSMFYGNETIDEENDLNIVGNSSANMNSGQTKKKQAGDRTLERSTSVGDGKISQQLKHSILEESDENVIVSRLAERHLLHGIRYFQQEIELLQLPTSSYASWASNERILHEICAAIANLSTMQIFRLAMVNSGMISTLLQVYEGCEHANPTRANHATQIALLKRICASTLHRLVVEEQTEIDNHGSLIPSLLSILYQSDEELHQIRYECEKVSIFTPNFNKRATHLAFMSPIRPGHFIDGSCNKEDSDKSLPVETDSKQSERYTGTASDVLPLTTSTHCVRQTYREQKWMVFVLRTSLSSSITPYLEKKTLRPIGVPKLSFHDIDSTQYSVTRSSASANSLRSSFQTKTAANVDVDGSSASLQNHSSRDSVKQSNGAYTLAVHMDKHHLQRENHRDDCDQLSKSSTRGHSAPRNSSTNNSTSPSRPGTAGESSTKHLEDQQELESSIHLRKFHRHMRMSRRKHRRNPNSLSLLSIGTT